MSESVDRLETHKYRFNSCVYKSLVKGRFVNEDNHKQTNDRLQIIEAFIVLYKQGMTLV